MTFKFECPSCGQRISATTADAGTLGICPACGNEFEVPAAALAPGGPAAAVSAPGPPGGLMLSMMALALCVMPGLCLTVLRSVQVKVSPVLFGALVVVLVALCVAGLVAGHRAWRRAVGQRVARVVSVLSLVIGYFSMIAMALLVGALVTGGIVLYRDHVEPPDFVAPDFMPSDLPLVAPDPTPQPVPKGPAER